MMLGADASNNMSGGVYISGWFLIGMGIHVWPIVFWGPLGVLCVVYTLVGGVWTYDSMRRGNWSVRKTLLVMLAIAVGVVAVIMLLPVPDKNAR